MTAVKQTCHPTELDVLFPTPSLPPTVLCPQRFPGTSPEAVEALIHVLKDNHIKYHIFFNELRFHNHVTHRALALYATGASGALIEHFYKQDASHQRPAIEPPEAITEENFIGHLGDDKYYAAYITFFMKSIDTKGVSATLEDYIFSEKYNLVEGRDASTQPVMLIRVVLGLIHPLIHLGYGTEFGMPGMVAEGLAMASVQDSHRLKFLPPSIFERGSTTAVQEITARLASLLLNRKTPIAPSQPDELQKNHAFSILAKIIHDPRFAPNEMEKYIDDLDGLLAVHGADIWRYAEQWTIDLSQPGEIDRKMEECIWTNTIIYAIGGWSKEKGFTADFNFMHLVTSSLFLSSVLSYLSQDSQVILLRAYFTTSLGWFISRCGPRLDIEGFLEATTLHPSSEGEVTSRANPFLDIVQSGITHRDDHMLKIQRAFAHFSSVYGARPKGYFMGTELEGAEALDGSLFFRAARLTDQYMNRGGGRWSFAFKMNEV